MSHSRNVVMLAVVVAAGLVCAAASPALAVTSIYETGFDQPTFNTGQLAGQGGWFGDPLPQVQNTVVNGGSQAVSTEAIGVVGQQVSAHSLSYSSVGNPEKVVKIGVDFMTPGIGGDPDPVVVWNPFGFLGDAGFLGQMFVRQTGHSVFGIAGIGPTDGPAITYGQWHRYVAVLDFDSRTLAGFIDGTLIASGPMGNASTGLTFVVLGINGTLGTGSNSIGYWDNLSVVSSRSVPEPVTGALGLMGVGALGLVTRRRRG